MKKQTVRSFAMLGLLLLFTNVSVSAQTERTVTNIPFDFIVGNRALAAGQYTIEPRERSYGSLWLIRSTNNSAAVFVITIRVSSEAEEKGKLVFHKYGDQLFLSQIWIPGRATGGELLISRLERNVAKNSVRSLVIAPIASNKR